MAVTLQYGRAVVARSQREDVMTRLLKAFVRDEGGADLIEYALLAGLIACACFTAMSAVGPALNAFFSTVPAKLVVP
jgi:Flp pilus assembly pilin Flp